MWAVKIIISELVLWVAGYFQITWMGYMAPLKLLGKSIAVARFKQFVAPAIKVIASGIISISVKALNWIGKKSLAALVNTMGKYVIATMLCDSMLMITACTSVRGLIAAIADYCTDKKFDGWIQI